MTPLRPSKSLAISAGLGLGLALAAPGSSFAQVNPGNANISTGSGAGTTPGVSPSSSPSGTRTSNAGTSFPSTGSTRQGSPSRPAQGGALGGNDTGGQPGTAGGGIDPITGIPNALEAQNSPGFTREELEAIDARAYDAVRVIMNPADRAMAMDRYAQVKIAAHQPADKRLDEAEVALAEGGEAALRVEDRVTRDIRLRLLIRTALLLADEQTREGLTGGTDPASETDRRPWSPRRRLDWLTKSEQVRQRAADLAQKIDNPTLRSEMLFRVVDSASQGSQQVAQAALLTDSRYAHLRDMPDVLVRMADRSLVFAANDASRITKPIWRDRSMVAIATAAAASEQFDRGFEISRTIPQPEYRSDALIRIAESQARRNLSGPATRSYTEAARAVASIPLEDPRATLASVLIDSLISVGRFEDARACVPFYPDAVRRQEALGTIAETQGERRLAQSAFAWIDSEAPPELRDMLRLRVNEGVLRAVERNRQNQGAFGGDNTTR